MPHGLIALSRVRHLVLLVLVMGLVVVPGRAWAQDEPIRTIDFDEAVQIALDQNTTLKRAANAVVRQDAITMRERMDFVPDLRISTGGGRSFGRARDDQNFQIVNESIDYFSADASSSITLFDGFANVASYRGAKLRGQSSELSLERTRQDVVFEVMDRYLAYIESQELIGVQEEELEARRQQLRRVEEEVEVGARPTSDLYQQQAQVAEAEQQLLNAQREAEVGKTRLIQTLQLDPFGDYQFEAPTVDDQDLTTQQYDLNRLLQTALQRRTDLQAQEVELQAAEQGVREARSQFFPTISASFSYDSNWNSLSTVPGVPEAGFFDVLDFNRSGRVGLSLSFPIFDRLQRNSSIEQAKVDRLNARYDLQDQRQQIALEVRQAYLDYENAEKQLDVAGTRLRAAERAREAAQERYDLGAAPFVELAQANADYVSAASEQVRARYNFIFQQKLIDYYLGVLDPQQPLLR